MKKKDELIERINRFAVKKRRLVDLNPIYKRQTKSWWINASSEGFTELAKNSVVPFNTGSAWGGVGSGAVKR